MQFINKFNLILKNIVKVTLSFICVAFFSNIYAATQTPFQNYQYWNNLKITLNAHKYLAFYVENDFRFNDKGSRLDVGQIEFAAQSKVYEKDLVGKYHKTNFSFTPVFGHRVVFSSGVRARPETSCNNSSSPKGCYTTEQMTFVMGIFNFNVKELAPKHGLSFTTQYRLEYRDFSNQSEKPKTGIGYTIFGLDADDKVFRFRNRLKLAYTYSYIEGYGITPYIQGEYFINLSNNSWKQPRNQINVDQTRVQVGIDFTIAKKYSIGPFYVWRLQYQQSELASSWNNQRQWGWQTENVFGMTTKFVF